MRTQQSLGTMRLCSRSSEHSLARIDPSYQDHASSYASFASSMLDATPAQDLLAGMLGDHATPRHLPLVDDMISRNDEYMLLQIDTRAHMIRDDSEPVSYSNWRLLRNLEVPVLF